MPLQKWSDQIWVCQLSREPAFSEDMEVVKSQFASADPAPHLVFDLSGVDVLNSSNLSQMLHLRKLAGDKDCRVRVAGPNDAVWSVFLTAGLDKVFDFSQDTAMALAEIQLGG